eukprot:TRINITY_DN1230_c0_g1_i2.p2 TRINITY_DN1230_c0_g1~~TRINITY_DN1230_c0_g1_i2.p2  ORF type:complete len:107 (+),score=20.90 TRINITY_DN1230_c0_g1_i2:350-670(+)
MSRTEPSNHRQNNFREIAPSRVSWAFLETSEPGLCWEWHRLRLAEQWQADVSRLQVYHDDAGVVRWVAVFVAGQIDPAAPNQQSNVEFLFPVAPETSARFSTSEFN